MIKQCLFVYAFVLFRSNAVCTRLSNAKITYNTSVAKASLNYDFVTSLLLLQLLLLVLLLLLELLITLVSYFFTHWCYSVVCTLGILIKSWVLHTCHEGVVELLCFYFYFNALCFCIHQAQNNVMVITRFNRHLPCCSCGGLDFTVVQCLLDNEALANIVVDNPLDYNFPLRRNVNRLSALRSYVRIFDLKTKWDAHSHRVMMVLAIASTWLTSLCNVRVEYGLLHVLVSSN